MKKNNILANLWEFLTIENFTKNQFKNFEDIAKIKFFKNGMKKTKKDLQQVYNLQCYGYYNNFKLKLYYDIID